MNQICPKTLRTHVILLLLAMFFCSCGSSDPGGENYETQLYLPLTELESAPSGGYIHFEVISDGNILWEIRNLPDWATASPMSSSRSENVKITVDANNDSIDREATFIVTSVSEAYPMTWKVKLRQEAE